MFGSMETFAVDKSLYEIGTPELKDIWDSDLDNSMHEVLRLNSCSQTHQTSSDLLPVEWNFLERELPVVLHDRLMTDAALGSTITRPIKHEHSYSLSSDGDSAPHSPTSHCEVASSHMDDMDVDCFPSINPASVKLPPEDTEGIDVKDEPYSETDSVHSSCPSSPQNDEFLNCPSENVDVDEYFADIDNIRKTLKQKPITTNYILSAATPKTVLQLDMLGNLTTAASNTFHLPPTPPSCSSSEEGEESTSANTTATNRVVMSTPATIQLSQAQQMKKQHMTSGTTRMMMTANSGNSRQPIHTPLISSQPKGSTGNLILTEEEKRTLLAEGYPVPTRLPLTKAEEKSLKKIRRKIKNKISAQESRRKKKEYMDQLERKVDILIAENNDYKKKLESLESSNTTLLNQLANLQAIVSRSHPQLGFSGDDASRTNQEASSSSNNSGGNVATTTTSGTITCTTNKSGAADGLREEDDDMKRAAARKKIERYFYQLTDGCGNPNCSNEFCASSGQLKDLSANQAAAQALELFAKEVPLCEFRLHPAKIARTLPGGDSGGGEGGNSLSESDISSGEGSSNSSTGSTPDNNSASASGECSGSAGTSAVANMGLPSNDLDKMGSEGVGEAKSNDIIIESVPYLTEQKLFDIIDDCEETKNYAKLIRTLGEVYSSIGSLARSFLQITSSSSSESPLDPSTSDSTAADPAPILPTFTPATKEHLRSLEGERDKDEDSLSPLPTPIYLTTPASKARAGWQSTFAGIAPSTVLNSPTSSRRSNAPTRPPVDLAAIRRSYGVLFAIPGAVFESALVTALVTLAGYLQIELQRWSGEFTEQDVVNVLVAVFEIPALGSGDFLETAFPALCRAVNWLPVSIQAQLAHVWSAPSGRSSLRLILENLQQLVTLRVILTQYHPDYYVQEENIVTSATKLMKVLYYANMLAGELESPDLREDDIIDDNYLGIKLPQTPPPSDPLAIELGLNVLDCRKPFLLFSEFYNEPLSEVVEMDRDFANYKSDTGKFCFMNYAFILTPATKTMGLYFDNRIRMYSERRISYFQSVSGQPSNPYLRLKVRRDHIIDDALVELEMISMENPVDLKKQLVVEFEGEQGIDEGGVSKEFFQLVIEEIFNPDYAMFSCEADTQTMWFNPTSFETDAQFTLIGIVLGLAIYNNIILAVNFPMVLYRKLMGKKGSFEDLQDWNPVLYNSLCSLLDYTNADLNDVYLQTFRVSYSDVFGTLHTHDLCPDGDSVPVIQENKHEFVNSYADFLLNTSVEKQFRAFSKGFQMVTDESPLRLLFRPEEVELLICGSKNFDFRELESSTEYDGGYTSTTPIIEQFWSITHALSLEDKRKLLQFATGSDRVPIGGLAKLKLVIARNGPDSNRLPTAHTCFNVLLLPEYSDKEKLEDRLLKAINYSKGFGML